MSGRSFRSAAQALDAAGFRPRCDHDERVDAEEFDVERRVGFEVDGEREVEFVVEQRPDEELDIVELGQPDVDVGQVLAHVADDPRQQPRRCGLERPDHEST